MEFLQPHMARINDFCGSLGTHHTFVHIPKATQYHAKNKQLYDGEHLNANSQITQQNESITRQLLKYNELKEFVKHNKRREGTSGIYPTRSCIQPVSVIVSEKSLSSTSSSSVPSPTSSVGGDQYQQSASSSVHHEYDSSSQEESYDKYNGDKRRHEENEDDDYHEVTGWMKDYRDKKLRAEYNYKPAPMIRKSRRTFISAEKKDSSYWERRRRNNEAAKKSRESRREKEIEVNLKCSNLEKENSDLRYEIMTVRGMNKQLENNLKLYKEILIKNNLL